MGDKHKPWHGNNKRTLADTNPQQQHRRPRANTFTPRELRKMRGPRVPSTGMGIWQVCLDHHVYAYIVAESEAVARSTAVHRYPGAHIGDVSCVSYTQTKTPDSKS